MIEHMAGRVVRGFEPEENWEDWVSEAENVKLESSYFQAEAIPLQGMPGEMVLMAMVAPEMEKMVRMYELFKLAVGINDQKKLRQIEVLTFGELNAIMAQWIKKSNETEPDEATDSDGDTGD